MSTQGASVHNRGDGIPLAFVNWHSEANTDKKSPVRHRTRSTKTDATNRKLKNEFACSVQHRACRFCAATGEVHWSLRTSNACAETPG